MSVYGKPSFKLGSGPTDYSPQVGAWTPSQGQQEFKRSPLNADGEETCYGLATDSVTIEVEDDDSNTLMKWLSNNRGTTQAFEGQADASDASDGKWTGNVLIPGISPTFKAGGEKKFSVTLPVKSGKLTYAES